MIAPAGIWQLLGLGEQLGAERTNLQLHWSADYLLRALNALGWLLMYSAVFLYEDREGKIQNVIVRWWVRVDDARITAHSRAQAFLQGVARLTVRGFGRVLGERLVSLRFAAVSLSLSIASLHLLAFFMDAVKYHRWPGRYLSGFAIFAVQALVPGLASLDSFLELCWPTLPLPIARRGFLFFWGAWVLVFSAWTVAAFLLFNVYPYYGAAGAGLILGYFLLAFGVSLICDISYVALTRWMLRKVSASGKVSAVVLMIAVNLLLLSVLLVAPIWLGRLLSRYWQLGGRILAFSSALNMIDIIAGSAALFLGIALLAHRLLWPVVEKPIYALQRYRIITNKKLLWGMGLALAFLPTHMTFGVLRLMIGKIAAAVGA